MLLIVAAATVTTLPIHLLFTVYVAEDIPLHRKHYNNDSGHYTYNYI